jgi:short-subunit dehydrogenase
MNDTAVAIVTGASRGLGAAIALWLVKVGAAVTLVARTGDRLEAVGRKAEALGGTALTVAADIAKPDDCHKTILLF